MRKGKFLKAAVISALFISFTPVVAGSADHKHHKAANASAGSGALIEEMRTLDAVFKEVVSAVALGDGHRVQLALESMHGKMEKTQEAVHKGEVKLRKNASKIAEFEKMDNAFHADLEMLAKAAHKGDRQNMTAYAKKLLDGCVACHNQFRP